MAPRVRRSNSPIDLLSFRRNLFRWFARHGRDLPWRHTRDPYAILVSEIMLQQTQVATVVPYYNTWLRRFPNLAALAAASESDVLHAWQGLGYYSRARNLHAAARTIVQQHNGFPTSIPQIRQLPGIGKYTAHAIATFAFDQPVPIVEANVTRVLSRLFNLQIRVDHSVGREFLWTRAAQLVPRRHAMTFNSALIDLGACVCTARIPQCQVCPVKTFCRTRHPEVLPVKKIRPQTLRLEEDRAFVTRAGKILLQQSVQRWRGMWTLPALKLDATKRSGFQTCPAYQSEFPFTHHRVMLRVFRARTSKVQGNAQHWFLFSDLPRIPIPSPHRRALNELLAPHKSFAQVL